MIQPLLLEQLADVKDIKQSKVKSLDFLFELLKNIDDKKVVKDLILHSNLDEKSKEFLFKKFDISKNLNKKHFVIDLDSLKKIEVKKTDKIKPQILKHINLPKKEDKSDEKHISIVSLLKDVKNDKQLEDEIKLLPVNLQIKVVEEIKNIIVSKYKQDNKIQSLINHKEFKSVKNIKDLITLTKKFDLNLTKIVIKQENNNLFNSSFVNEKLVRLPKNESLKLLNRFTKNINKSKSLEHKVEKNSVSLKTLLDVSKTKKTTLKDIDEINLKDSLNAFNEKEIKLKNVKNNSDNNDNDNVTFSINTEFKSKVIEAKQSIGHFVSSLKEAVENYKPPLTKLSLELHPKELGKVEVVIKQQGENLNIQINTQNQTTINFLTTQQQELKNSLVNMGFTNINMNFNSNHQNQKQNSNQKHNQYQASQNEEDELVIDFTYKYA